MPRSVVVRDSQRGEPEQPVSALPFQRWGHVKAMAGALMATGALVPPTLLTGMVRPRMARHLPPLWHRAITCSLGIRTSICGVPDSGSVLYVANHMSWVDIPVLGSRLDGSFVAKAEVEEMPFVKFLAGLQQTLYINRQRRTNAPKQANEIRQRLKSGGNVILFPEGTSTDGVRVNPFKSSLFSVLDQSDNVRIQPISLAYTHLNGMPISRQRLLDIVWIGDMEFGSHVIDFMRLGNINARIYFHPSVCRTDFSDRKAVAKYCHSMVAQGYQGLIRGEI